QAAEISGLSATTLRYYESLGLIRPDRAPNGYRVYGSAVLDRLRFIEAATYLRLPREEIVPLVDDWASGSCASVKERLGPMVTDRLARVEDGLVEMARVRRELEGVARHLDDLPDRADRCGPTCAFDSTSPPVACSLGPEQGGRVVRWRALLGDAPRVRLGGGVRADLPISSAAELMDLSVAEQECCPFLTFTITLLGRRVALTVTAPPEGMPMVDEIMGTQYPAGP